MTTVSAFPPPPSRADPANFAARGDAFFAQFPIFVTQVNLLGTEINADALSAQGNAATAQSARIAAESAAVAARASELAAAGFASQSAATFTQGAIALLPKKLTNSQSIPAGFNAVSVGPIEIADGVTISVANGSTWSIT
jgi:hypothetical protein